MLRCNEKGFVEACCPDGRRGLWIRADQAEGVLELCAGREGDDAHVLLTVGEKLTEQNVTDLVDVLTSTVYAFDMTGNAISLVEDPDAVLPKITAMRWAIEAFMRCEEAE